MSVRDKIHPKDHILLSGSKIEVLAGGRLSDPYNNTVSYKEHKPELQFMHIPGFGRVEYQFIVKGKGNIKLEYKSQKAKNLVVEGVL